jgi:UDP-3-O-acyl N-acetylglucosamine deacetylase
VLEPLPPDTGIHFAKIGDVKPVPAFVDYVHSTSFATTISASGQGSGVSTIEHLLSTLHAYKISNLLIKCNDEVPIFDGSAAEFCRVIEEVGIKEQEGRWYEIAVDRPIMVSGSQADLESEDAELLFLEPSDQPGLTVSYDLNYPAPVGRQTFEFTLNDPAGFKQEIAPARTFGFMKDIEKLQRAGLAEGGRLDNFILIGSDGIVNTELRFEEELARHKILDAIGDLFLLGRPLSGKLRARMTGHSDNIRLVSTLKDLL